MADWSVSTSTTPKASRAATCSSISNIAMSNAVMSVSAMSDRRAASRTKKALNQACRVDPAYRAGPNADGLYTCPFKHSHNCNHGVTPLKCNYDKWVDSHLRPFHCTSPGCKDARFSSTACLLRHERERHAMHGHGHRPFSCLFPSCTRAAPGHGFPRMYNLLDHMRRMHKWSPADSARAGLAAAAASGSTAETVGGPAAMTPPTSGNGSVCQSVMSSSSSSSSSPNPMAYPSPASSPPNPTVSAAATGAAAAASVGPSPTFSPAWPSAVVGSSTGLVGSPASVADLVFGPTGTIGSTTPAIGPTSVPVGYVSPPPIRSSPTPGQTITDPYFVSPATGLFDSVGSSGPHSRAHGHMQASCYSSQQPHYPTYHHNHEYQTYQSPYQSHQVGPSIPPHTHYYGHRAHQAHGQAGHGAGPVQQTPQGPAVVGLDMSLGYGFPAPVPMTMTMSMPVTMAMSMPVSVPISVPVGLAESTAVTLDNSGTSRPCTVSSSAGSVHAGDGGSRGRADDLVVEQWPLWSN